MKHQFTLTVESKDFQPDTALHGPLADAMARHWLKEVKITTLRIENIEEPVTVLALLKGPCGTEAKLLND